MNKDIIFDKITSANNQQETKFNFIVVPVAIFNIIELHPSFKSIWIEPEIDGLVHVGYLGNLHCFVDMFLPPDQIVMRYDKQTERENKLNSILSNSQVVNEILIKIENNFH